MKSLERNFSKMKAKYPDLHTLPCFRLAVIGNDFNADTIHRWFYVLVDKNDYAKEDRCDILRDLKNITQNKLNATH